MSGTQEGKCPDGRGKNRKLRSLTGSAHLILLFLFQCCSQSGSSAVQLGPVLNDQSSGMGQTDDLEAPNGIRGGTDLSSLQSNWDNPSFLDQTFT